MEFKFPDVGEGIHEGVIVKWRVKEGQKVKADEVIVEMETDKAVVELPAPTSGVIKKIKFKEGETVKVGETLVVIEEEAAKEEGKREEKVIEKEGKRGGEARVLASPATRRLARELGVDIKAIKGSGPGGRVTREDVLRAAGREVKKAEEEKEAVEEEKVEEKKEMKGVEEEKRVPITHLRKVIAERMVYSATHIPQACGMDYADVTKLVEVREREKARFDVKITYLPFIVKACTIALKKYPQFNAHYDEEKQELVMKKKVNIGIAVDTEAGLMVPVIKDVEKKSIVDIAKEIWRLAEGARKRTLSLDELKGSTFTITNIGSIGGMYSFPLINPPEVAILGVHRIKEWALPIEGKIEVRKVMGLSLSFDHRVLDGAHAARFMNEVKKHLEDPELLLMEMV